MKFFVAEELSAPMILGCDYAGKYIEEIKPRKRFIEIPNAEVIPITQKHSEKYYASHRSPEEQK